MNATIMKGERSKLLAVAVVFAMVACALVAFMPSADAYETTDVVGGQVNVGTSDDLTQALTDDTVSTIVLTANITGDFTVSRTVTINLAGFTITNSADHTITVASGGNLTVKDSSADKTGTVDNITHAKGALYIDADGTATLDAGTFVRSEEAGSAPNDNGGNSWYVINNFGTLTINDGVKVISALDDGSVSAYSSIIRNGENSSAAATLTVNGGDFFGGLYVKNENGSATIKNGTFKSYAASVFTYGELTINGGTFNGGQRCAVWAYSDNTWSDVPDLKINGGTFITGDSEYGTVRLTANSADANPVAVDIDDSVTGITLTVNENTAYTGSTGSANVTNNGMQVTEDGKVTVNSEAGLKLDEEKIIDGKIEITSVVTVSRAVNIVGINGATLAAVPNDGPYNSKYSSGTDKYVLNITAGANIKNLTVDSNNAAFGINIWSGETTITDVVSNNSAGAAFTIGGGATVTMGGTSASGYVWGGVNADKSATVTFVDAEAFENVGSVYGEDSAGVTIYLPTDYKAAVEMTGKWETDETKTDFKGYYTTLDKVLPYYNDSQSRFNYDGSKIAVNKDTTNNKDFTLKSGTTLAIADNVTLTNADEVTFTIEYGATVEGTISGGKYILTPDNDGNYTYPEFEDGTVIIKDDAEYVVCHGETSTHRIVQYGVGIGQIIYNGSSIYGEYLYLEGTSLDNYFVAATDISGSIYDPNFIGTNPEESCINAGTYKMDIIIKMITKESSGSVTNIYDTIDIEIQPATSELVFGTYTGDVYGVASDKLSVGGITATTNDTNVTLNGTLIYYDGTWDADTWPAGEDEGYYALFSIGWMKGIEYVDTEVVLSYNDKTYDAVTFDNFLLVFLGTEPALDNKLEISIDYDGEKGNFSENKYTIDFSALQLKTKIILDDYTENVYGVPVSDLMEGGYTISEDGIVATLIYYDGTGWDAGTWGADESKGYYLVLAITNPTGDWSKATVTINEKTWNAESEAFDGFLVLYIGDITAKNVLKIEADIDGSATKYVASALDVPLTLTSSAEVKIDVIEGDEQFDFGAAITDLQSADASATPQTVGDNVFDITFNGMVYWKNDYTWYNTAVADEQRGWYLGYKITTPAGDDWSGIMVTVELADGTEKVWTGEDGDVFDGFIIWRVAPDYERTVTVTYDNVPYTFNLKLGDEFKFGTSSGFVLDADDVSDGEGKFVIEGITLDDVIDDTYYMIFNTGKTEAGVADYVMRMVDADNNVVYSESEYWKQKADGGYIWYFSADDQLKGKDIPGGVYKLQATLNGEVVAESEITYAGSTLTSYEDDANAAYNAMVNKGMTPSEDFKKDVAPETMFMVFYAPTDLTGFIGTLSYEGKVVYTETHSDASISKGIHAWYFTFDESNADWIGHSETGKVTTWTADAILEGTYTLTITDADGNVIAVGEYEYIDKTYYHVTYIDEEWDGGKYYEYYQNIKVGTDFKLPDLPDGSKVAKGWEVLNPETQKYDLYGENTYVDLSKYVDETTYGITFYAVYDDEQQGGSGDDKPVVIDPTVTIDMPGSAVANGEWIYYNVTTSKGTYDGNVMGFATAVDGATVQYFENTTGAWMPLPTGDDGMYYFGNPETGFPMANATSYFRVAFDTPGSYYIIVLMKDMSGKVVCSNSAAIEVVADSQITIDKDQRTQYDVGAELNGNILTVSVTSTQTAANYVNLHNAAFYYKITVQIGDKTYYLNNVIASKIIEGEYQYQDSQSIDLSKAITGVTDFAGATITVQFSYDYGLTTYGADTIIIEDAIGDAIDFSEDASDAYKGITEALEGSGITIAADEVAAETVYSVFEADAGDYVLTMETSDGTVVYAEAASFANDGTHIWYFSLAEGQPSWSSDYALFPLVEGAVQSGTTYDLRINGTLIGQITL